VIPRARGAASRLLQEAEGYRSEVIANAEGDASRFKQVLAEYQKAPAVTRDRMYLETMQQIFSNTTKVMVDSRSANNLLYLPLEKLISQTASQPPGGGTANPAAQSSKTLNESLQSMDNQRQENARSSESRAREGR
jgi:membrane protease subunit HflK